MPKTMSIPLYFSNPAENADNPAAPPKATAKNGSQQQLVASRKPSVALIKDCCFFM